MSGKHLYGIPRDHDEYEAMAEILGRSFIVPDDEQRLQWIETAGRDRWRVLRRDGAPAACLALLDMGQFFGGRRVSMSGVSAVAVEPAFRGRGAALELMRESLGEMRESGIAVSSLFPAAWPLYRAAGYELAGDRFWGHLSVKRLGVRAKGPSLREAGPEDDEAVRSAYLRYAAPRPGFLDRCDTIWRWIRRPHKRRVQGYLVEEEGEVTGYLYLEYKEMTESGHDIIVRDLVAHTAASARRILGFLSEHRSLGNEARLFTAPTDLFVAFLPEGVCRMKLDCAWMLRVVDVRAALEQRGYPEGLAMRLDLEVRDDLFADNSGRFRLDVEGGRGEVRPGGDGALGVDVRGLASLYTGYLCPAVLGTMGLLEGKAQALAAAASLFAGPSPWMPDMF